MDIETLLLTRELPEVIKDEGLVVTMQEEEQFHFMRGPGRRGKVGYAWSLDRSW